MRIASQQEGRRLNVVLPALCLILMVWTLPACGGSGSDERRRALEVRPTNGRSHHSPEIEEREWLRANFRLVRTKPEGLPPSVANIMREAGPADALARAQRIPGVSKPIWAVLLKDRLCLVAYVTDMIIGTSCASEKQALRHGVATTSLRDESPGPAGSRSVTVGLVPDGTRRVRVRTLGTPSVTVSAARGVFILRSAVDEPPDRIELVP